MRTSDEVARILTPLVPPFPSPRIFRPKLMNNANDKQYATVAQREALKSIGILHERGRTRQSAQQIIDENVRNGRLPADVLIRPTEKQIEFLRALGADVPDNLTKERASELIDSLTRTRPLSRGQADFIEHLGGVALPSLTYRHAGEFIEYLLDRESKCSRCGATDNRRDERCSCGAYLPKSSPIYPSEKFGSSGGTRDDL
jgi:hypothetical protein